MANNGVPIYLITGFLESGKTSFIRDLLNDEGFTDGERTLLICCEEGIEEYEDDLLKKSNTILVNVESQEEFGGNFLPDLEKKYRPERVIIEYNSVWGMKHLGTVKKPKHWELYQVVDMVDSSTFELYLNNMRQMMTDGMQKADLVLFNRCNAETKKSAYRRTVRAMNAATEILFENLDGSTEDGISDEDLPYDMKAATIKIHDDQFGVFYLDAMEHPERYDGKTICIKGKAFDFDGLPNGCYIFGRHAMTCCADDISGIGFVCKVANLKEIPGSSQWIEITAKVQKGFSMLHRREAIILIQQKMKLAKAPEEELVTFNNI